MTLDRNNSKNRKFDQEVPQNLRSEQAPIAHAQGASENKNSEGLPTPSKADSSSCFGLNVRGAFVALATPFDRRGNIDWKCLEKLISWQIEEGTDGIVCCGATGEG